MWVDALMGAMSGKTADFLTHGIADKTRWCYMETREALLLHKGYGLEYYLGCLFRSGMSMEPRVDVVRKVRSALNYLTLGCETVKM